MTIQRTFFNWSTSGLRGDPPYNACSPNLGQVRIALQARFGAGQFLGCYAPRPIRDGTAPSAHSLGAAIDWRYPAGTKLQVLGWLIDNSAELGIDAIHDYAGCRIWRAGRTANVADAHGAWWKTQPANPSNGMGQAWADYVHIETTFESFSDTTPIDQRLTPQPPEAWKMKPTSARALDTRGTPGAQPGTPLVVPIAMAHEALIRVQMIDPGKPSFVSADGGKTAIVNSWDGGSSDGTAYVALANGRVTLTVSAPCHLIVDVQGAG